MHHAAAKFGTCGKFVVDVKRIVVARKSCECDNVLSRNCADNGVTLPY